MNKWLQEKLNILFGTNKLNWFLGVFWIGFAIVGIYTFGHILVVNFSLSTEISSGGFINFFELFDGPIKLLTASVAFLALFLTSRRMEQTEEQVLEMSKNNQFTNYYKQREEFVKYRDTELLNLHELVQICDTLKDEGKNLESSQFEMYLKHNYKTEFLRVFAFFFGNHPGELRLPFSENAEVLISYIIALSESKSKILKCQLICQETLKCQKQYMK